MKRILLAVVVIVLLGIGGFIMISGKNEKTMINNPQDVMDQSNSSETPMNTKSEATGVKISTTAFNEGEAIPEKCACNGENVNPEIDISGTPENAKSLVLIVDDTDAPSGIFTHWLLWNIDPGTTEIAENSVPAGAIVGTNDFGNSGYNGPCPPSGMHRYYFRIYALDTLLDLDENAKRMELNSAITNHILTESSMMGTYAKSLK